MSKYLFTCFVGFVVSIVISTFGPEAHPVDVVTFLLLSHIYLKNEAQDD